MTDPLSLVLKFLDAKLATIFAIAVGALVFLLLPDAVLQRLKISDLGDVWRTSALFVDLVLWAYLFSRLGIYLFDAFKKIQKSLSQKKATISYLDSESSMKMGEIVILVGQKRKNERQFMTNRDDEFLCTLSGKGLVTKVKWVRGFGQEYLIPEFVWKSKRLQELVDKYGKSETLRKLARQ